MKRVSTGFLSALLWALLSACSAHPKKVDCEGHLQAINAPAPISVSSQKDARP